MEYVTLGVSDMDESVRQSPNGSVPNAPGMRFRLNHRSGALRNRLATRKRDP